MAARSLEQILSELGSTYDPQINQIRERQALIPGQIAEEEKGLGAKQEQAFGDILGGARRRGLGFSGIPLGEQAKYTATEYLPALARLRQGGREQAMSLEDAILGIQERRNTMGNQLYQQGLQQDLAERQSQEDTRRYNEQAASRTSASSGSINPFAGLTIGQSTPATPPSGGAAKIAQRADKGFNFTDASGRAISAAQYAQFKAIPFRQLLQQMANAGDTGAKKALDFVGDDFGVNKKKIASPIASAIGGPAASQGNLINILNSLLWGVNRV